MNNKYFEIFKSWNYFYCIAAVVVATYIIVLPQALLSYIFPSLELGLNETMANKGWPEKIFVAIVFAPIIETFLFQYLPHRILLRGIGLNWKLVSLVSALLFGLSHWFGFGYIVFAVLIGLVLILTYILLFESNKNPFLVVMLAHVLRNSIALVIAYFFVH